MLAGYHLRPGYEWHGECLAWSLEEMTKVDLHESAKKLPPSTRTPHLTKVARLPDGGRIFFPLKAEYNRLNFTLEGRRGSQEKEKDEDAENSSGADDAPDPPDDGGDDAPGGDPSSGAGATGKDQPGESSRSVSGGIPAERLPRLSDPLVWVWHSV